ncbi:hypothetical protein FV222_02490 [Methylobacterium sp. WL103]|uniref:hypothetical protein n=1 Tax=Methylobacterium sp. WL103 TaxID=2603891 RepID=UPI0011C832A3|nr:hypothetical protein [Methylobacterium sp. WL103]TXN07389.1 hypothetical protein FV222_02490 [Methylobacterium sp. WL103]
MADDDAEEFRRQVRAALAAAGRLVDPSLEEARRVLEWLRATEGEGFEAGSDDDEMPGGDVAAG